MSKVTVSDFIIALMDLLEAESRALQESATLFMEEQRASLQNTLYRSGWMVAWIVAAVTAMLGAVGFAVWGLYLLFARYVSETGAPFAAGAVLLLCAALFTRLAMKARV
ncbi:hypothetical protein [Hydrogenimonas urashimensis]|uniref:hypothetical protein n=1 Tax=Hydrogenimonas urashimensis TaxID=2740515 RepID=UPI0019164FC7|nr:hypothetical protein [Hydrogenimonas urashimensis]